MTHVSLFSGIGGLDLAAEWAGFETVLQVERDPYCLRVLRKHWPRVRRVKDVRHVRNIQRKVGARAVDVLSGGFPCQPFSVAGKRLGTADARNFWPRMRDVVECLRPRWVVAENVRGLLSWNEGVAFEAVCSDLEDLGYEVLPLVYPVAGVGAPHLRYRVFIVAQQSVSGGRQEGGLSVRQGRPFQAEAEPSRASENASHAFLRRVRKQSEFQSWLRSPTVSLDVGEDGTDAPSERRGEGRAESVNAREAGAECDSGNVPYADHSKTSRQREHGGPGLSITEAEQSGPGGEPDGDSISPGLAQWEGGSGDYGTQFQTALGADWWTIEPDVCGISDEFPKRMDGDLNKPETHEIMGIGEIYANAEKARSGEVLHGVRGEIAQTEVQRNSGRQREFQEKKVLQQVVHGCGNDERRSDVRNSTETRREVPKEEMRNMRIGEQCSNPSSRQKSGKQFIGEPDDIMRCLSHAMALDEWQEGVEETVGLHNLRKACEEIGYVSDALSTLQEIWRSLANEEARWICLRISTGNPWCSEWPGAQRVSIGVKNRVDRLRGLGNAVSPYQAFPVFAAIATMEGTA